MENIKIYGTIWCPDCHRSKRLLESKEIPFEWVNIDKDKSASSLVKEINNGNRSVPTIIFPDGSHLTEPSNAELLIKIEEMP